MSDPSGNALTGRNFPKNFDTDDVGEATGFVNQWLDQAVRLYENGALHPSVMRAIAPMIDSMSQIENARKGVTSTDPRLDNPDASISPYERTPAQYVNMGRAGTKLQGGVPKLPNDEDYGPAANQGDAFGYMRRR